MGELDMQKGNRPARGKGPKLARAGVVLIVLIAVAAGGATVYRMPSTCGVCHTPMAEYVDNYHGGDASLMITGHARAEDALVCLDCHESELRGDTVRGVRWVTGDYEFPLPKAPMGTRAFCLESGCHDEREILEETESLESARLADGTADYNPHDPRHGRQECSSCHTMHGKSVLMCSQCHDLVPPEGWVTPDVTGLVASR